MNEQGIRKNRTCPSKELENSNPEPDTGTRNQEPRTADPRRVLVVDDERSMRELLSIVLRREGYDVTLAENGRMALDQLDRARFDLLISDIKMPDMSGVDVLRAAKRIDQDILGIMITAYASADTAIEAMRLGAHDYLASPSTSTSSRSRCATHSSSGSCGRRTCC